ncbi:hypothetical protein LTR53_007306 [Teratosphaeriaceae sp. CCFEE 6253]|nr:hypothetical protein LTR53_007306 [Teratosphaeriaceae sp. CCFEE 6253]
MSQPAQYQLDWSVRPRYPGAEAIIANQPSDAAMPANAAMRIGFPDFLWHQRLNASSPSGLATLEMQADAMMESLRALYELEMVFDNAFGLAMANFAGEDAPRQQAFRTHVLRAFAVTASNVRAIDIITWYDLTGLPANIAVWQQALMHAEERDHGIGLGDDDTYAVTMLVQGKPAYGHETEWLRSMNNPGSWTPRFEGFQCVQHLVVSFEVRKTRVEHAPPDERYPAKGYHSSVEYLLVMRVGSAIRVVTSVGFPGMATMSKTEEDALWTSLRAMRRYADALPRP